jgi:cytochrome b6-f complex iron-sulfur subunit
LIAILPPEGSADSLAEIRRALEGRGWSCAFSTGRTQTIATVVGPSDVRELDAALAPMVVADVVELLSAKDYARLRRRRRVMHGIAWGLLALIVLGLGLPALAFARAPVATLVAPDVVFAATVDELPENSARLVRPAWGPVLLVHLNGGRFFAVEATCTHEKDCQLEWSRERQQIVCPCHGCVYDVYGNVIEGPASAPLGTVPIERAGDKLFVRRSRG